MVKEFLSREGHPFVVKNIEDDDAAYDELVKLGARAVPTTVIAADDAAQATRSSQASTRPGSVRR